MTVSPMTTANSPAVQARWRRTIAAGYALTFPPLLLVMLIIVLPALGSVIQTVSVDLDGSARFTLNQYLHFLNDPFSMANLIYTLRITFTVVGLLFAICLPIALYLRFSRGWLAGAVQMLALFPLFVPGIVLSYALIRFFVTHGLVESILTVFGVTGYKTPYLQPEGAILGLVWESIPFTTLLLTAGLSQIDDALLESGRDVGASGLQIFWRIILPLMKNSLVIVFTLNFLGIFGSYTIPYMLGPAAPEMMGVFMQRTYSELRQPIEAQTQAIITFIVSALAGYFYVRTVVQQRREQEQS